MTSSIARDPIPLEEGLAERTLTPALVVDLAACRRNIDAVLALTAGPARWRPHVKTAKIPEVFALYARSGVRRFKCATTREASVLARVLEDEGVLGGDVLVAHHLFGPGLNRLAAIAREHPSVSFSTLVESPDQIPSIPEPLGVFIDIDLGMGRTGIDIAETRTIQSMARAAAGRLRGLHAYDGHRLEADVSERARRIHASYDELVALCKTLQGDTVREVITAGTPAFPAALEHQGLALLEGWVHRVSPGTVVFHDLRSVQQLPELASEFAATVLTRVASLRRQSFTTDAGSKAIEASGPGQIAEAVGHPSFAAVRQSEEHTVFEAQGDAMPERGALLRLVPGHVCPTANLATQVLLVENGAFVGIADVAAAGHEAHVENAGSNEGSA